MKMLRFLIHLILAQSIALGVGKFAKDQFEMTFYTTFICLLVWDALIGVIYLTTPANRHQARYFQVLFSVAMAWLVPIVLIIAIVLTPPQTLQSLLHFGR